MAEGGRRTLGKAWETNVMVQLCSALELQDFHWLPSVALLYIVPHGESVMAPF
jgi:hypothetical protein